MHRRLGSVLVAIMLSVAPGVAVAANPTSHYRESTDGATVVFSTCPFGDWTPTGPTICDDWQVSYMSVSTAIGGGPISPMAPFRAFYEHSVTAVTPTDAVGLIYEFGDSGPLAGTYDATKLSVASMPGATLSLTRVDIPTGVTTSNVVQLGAFTWTAAAPIQRFGNDGPLGGLPGNYRDRCITLVSNSNQKLRGAQVTGSVDGVDINSRILPPPAPGAPADAHGVIFGAWYRVTLVPRC